MTRPDEVEDEEQLNDNDSGEDEAESEISDAASDSSAGGAVGTEGKKKKKKKKKNKAKKGGSENGAASAGAASSSAPKVDKAEADRKFAAALTAIKDEDLWVELNNSAATDAKLKKLLEQLKKNQSVTSINLSQNSLTDESAQALASVLGISTVVPGLITLDLRENTFTDTGLTVLDGLKKVRRDLTIMTGPIVVPEPTPAPGKGGAGSKALGDLSDSRLVRKYFQIGNEDEDDSANAGVASEPAIDPADLWQQLKSAVQQGKAGIPAQQSLLKQLSHQVTSELSSIPDGDYQQQVSRCPHVKACLDNLQTLQAVLALTPDPVTVQYSRQPQAAVGSHRVFTAEAVAGLLSSGSPTIDQSVATAKLVPQILHLAISHPLCSALHARTLKLMRSALASKVTDLLGSVMTQPGWGSSLQAPAYTQSEGQESAPCPPLPTFLAAQGTAAVGVVSGRRHPLVGFVIEATKVLHSALHSGWDSDSDDEPPHPHLEPLKLALAANTAWSEFCQKDTGAFARLSKEQEGDLGGPRAVRTANPMDGAELAELAGGGLITGPEILALLQGMSGMGTS